MNTIAPQKMDFEWSGRAEDGRLLTGVIQAMSPNIARLHLKKQGITADRIKKKSNKKFLLGRAKLSDAESITFFRQLSTLLNAGIPILQCCDIFGQTQTSYAFQTFIKSCRKDIANGKTLSASLKNFPKEFGNIVCQLIYLGEQSGTLDRILRTLADYKEKTHALKRKVFQALFYPCIVLVTALAISLIMLTYVVPRFEELFNNMHTPLPLFTQGVVNVSHFIRDNYWLSLLVVLAIGLFHFTLKTSAIFKAYFDVFSLKIPIIHRILEKIISARFTRHFATLFEAGIPIVEALKMISPILSNDVFVRAVERVQQEIAGGERLYNALQQHSPFPNLVIQMIKIGEESGTLEIMLYKLAEQYETDIEYWVGNLSHLLEPLIMIILGVLIGGLVIAMYLPIFKLGTII